MRIRHHLLVSLLLLGVVVLAGPRPATALTAPNLEHWLYYEHPEVAAAIVWEFPETGYQPQAISTNLSSVPGWLNGALKTGTSSGLGTTADSVATSASGPTSAVPAPPPDFEPGAGRTLQWYYWPPAAKAKLQGYYNYYFQWLSEAWPLYQSYRDSGFKNKPPGFAEKFEAPDPEVQSGQDLLPFAATAFKDNQTKVLYDSNAAFELNLKNLAMMLALETGNFLKWKMAEDAPANRAVLLDGRYVFRYFPAGSHPWGGQQTVDHGGHDATGTLPAPALLTLKFLIREGILRDTRFDTVAQWLEWERSLHHAMGNPQTLVGECGKEFEEVIWGTKGAAPASRLLLGTAMVCRLVSPPGSNSQNTYFDPEVKSWTGGCGMTGFLNHRVLRQINLPAESVASIGHGQTRFVVEKAPFRQMFDPLQAGLPPEPKVDDGMRRISSVSNFLPLLSSPEKRRSPQPEASSPFENVYLSHNDDPYSLTNYTDVPERELLFPEDFYHRWLDKAPEYLSTEQVNQYYQAHSKFVSLRPMQLLIHHLPLRLLQDFCLFDADQEDLLQTKTFEKFNSYYTAAELEGMGFWTRLEQKIGSLGGCGNIPPPYGT